MENTIISIKTNMNHEIDCKTLITTAVSILFQVSGTSTDLSKVSATLKFNYSIIETILIIKHIRLTANAC